MADLPSDKRCICGEPRKAHEPDGICPAHLPSKSQSLVEEARRWPRDSFGEGRLFNELADEIERLRAALQRYARHDELCNLRLLRAHPVKCTCGLYLALAGEVEARPMMSADGGKDIPL